VDVQIRVNGKGFVRLTANEHRPDLEQAFHGSTGKNAFTFAFTPPLSIFHPQEVEVVALPTGERVSNGHRRLPPITRSAPVSRPSPILVSSAGRSGSSFLMKLLAAHPDILVASGHPYEIKMMSYYALVLRTLLSESDPLRSLHPDNLSEPTNVFSIGFNPFHDHAFGEHPGLDQYWANTAPDLLAGCVGSLIAEYYERWQCMTSKFTARYFAEKAYPDGLAKAAITLAFGRVWDIVLVRDPRDLLCSYKAFWGSDIETAIDGINKQLRHFGKLKSAAPADTIFVKYEDLIQDTNGTAERICGFLDLPAPQHSQVHSAAGVFGTHGTSANPASSIGRWKRDLNPTDAEICCRTLEHFLLLFGYEI
jgi:hypothetical protein